MTSNKRVRLIALAAVSAIGSIAFLPARSHANAEVSGNASPRSLYLQNCARCHGADGKAQTKLGQSLGGRHIGR
jgi:mono/diheme cytochrome c family protein